MNVAYKHHCKYCGRTLSQHKWKFGRCGNSDCKPDKEESSERIMKAISEQEPAWLARLANAKDSYECSAFEANGIACEIRLLREAARDALAVLWGADSDKSGAIKRLEKLLCE